MKNCKILLFAFVVFALFISCCANLNYRNVIKTKDYEIVQLKKEVEEIENTIDELNHQIGVFSK